MVEYDEDNPIDYNKGYVIRCVDQDTGRVLFRGANKKYSYVKDSIRERDTYTFFDAKKALANLERMYPEADFYSIEKISSHYLFSEEWTIKSNSDEEKRKISLLNAIEKAMIRLDEIWDGNDFDNGDKMRINEIRSTFKVVNEYLLEDK